MHSEPIHLVIAINQKYIRYAYVMLTSLLLHTSCDVHVYVLHRELNAADQQTFDTLTHSYPVTFHFIHVPDALLPPQKVLATSAWGAEAYFRLAITDLMPSLPGTPAQSHLPAQCCVPSHRQNDAAGGKFPVPRFRSPARLPAFSRNT